MDSAARELCVMEYGKLKNLKLVSEKLKFPLSTIYWNLKKAGIEVIGDKNIYGSSKDKLACRGEDYIEQLLPNADNQNKKFYQPKVDFIINEISLEIKSARQKGRWAFSLKKQRKLADFFLLLAFDLQGREIKYHFLIPNKMILSSLETLSIPINFKNSKWGAFLISKKQIKEFFSEI